VNPLRSIDIRRAGLWINWRHPSRVFQVGDHQVWIRDPSNASRLGVSERVMDRFGDYPYEHGDEQARAVFLRFVMQNAPVVRIRGHGDHITFEYHADTQADVERAGRCVRRFCHQAGVGEYMGLKIVNLCCLPGGTTPVPRPPVGVL
jgi:hypothetical protein